MWYVRGYVLGEEGVNASALVLADARPPALLASAPDVLVLADARPPAILAFAPPLLATAPDALVRTDTARPLVRGVSRCVGPFSPPPPARATAGRSQL